MTETFPSGAVRDSRKGKGRFDLLSHFAIMRLARHYERGVEHYGDRNYEKGMPISRFLDSALRHIFQYIGNHSDEDHLAAAAWNLMSAMHTECMIAAGEISSDLLDLPAYPPTFLTTTPQAVYERTKSEMALDKLASNKPLHIYLATTYSDGGTASYDKRRANVKRAAKIGRAIARLGHIPFVPHIATAFFDEYFTYEQTMQFCLSILPSMDAILRDDAPSEGGDRELKEAKRLNLVVFESLDEIPNLRQTRGGDGLPTQEAAGGNACVESGRQGSADNDTIDVPSSREGSGSDVGGHPQFASAESSGGGGESQEPGI